MAEEPEIEEGVSSYPGFARSTWRGITNTALEILNSRLREKSRPVIQDLEELKEASRNGLFRKSLKDVTGKGVGRLVNAEIQKKMLVDSGLGGSDLSFTGTGKYKLDDVLEKAIELTDELVVKETTLKTKAVAKKTKEIPTTSTACGETFDPERCSLSKYAKSPYRLEEVQAFLKTYHIYEPTAQNADYKSLCDLLKDHWTRYMTAALVDVFGSGKAPKISSRELRNMAIERGIKFEKNDSDEEITRLLIRYMVDNILTIDAAQYGLGESAVSIVDTLMGGDLNIEHLEPKARLAVIMVGARFNKKLLDFVTASVDADVVGTPEFKKEFNNFQQGLAHLRRSVEEMKPAQSAKVVEGLAAAIAKTAKTTAKKTAAAVSQNTSAPLATKPRVKQEILEFLSNAVFNEHPEDSFKMFAELLDKSGIADMLAKTISGSVVLATTDAAMKDITTKIFKTDFETLSSLRAIHNGAKMMVVKADKLKEGNFKSSDGASLKVSSLGDKFEVVDVNTKFSIFVSEEYNDHDGIKFYRATNMLMKRDYKAAMTELAERSKAPEVVAEKPKTVKAKSKSPVRPKTPETIAEEPAKPRSKSKSPVRAKTPEPEVVVQEPQPMAVELPPLVETKETEEEVPPEPAKPRSKSKSPVRAKTPEVVAEEPVEPVEPPKKPRSKSKSPVRPKTPEVVAEKPTPAPVEPVKSQKKPNLCTTILEAYKHRDIAKLSLMILGGKSVFGSASSLPVETLRKDIGKTVGYINGSKTLNIKATEEIASFLIRLKEIIMTERKENGLFDVSVNLNNIPATCQSINDLMSGLKKASIPAVPVVSKSSAVTTKSKKPSKPAKPATPEPEEGETVELGSIDEIIEVTGTSIFMSAIEAYDVDGKAILNASEQVTLFAPTNEAFEALLSVYNLSEDEFLQNTDLLEAVMTAHYTYEEEENGSFLMQDNETTWEPEGTHYETDGVDLYVVNEVKLSEQAQNFLSGSSPSSPASPKSPRKEQSECETIIDMTIAIAGERLKPKTMAEFFGADSSFSIDKDLLKKPLEDFKGEYADNLASVSGADQVVIEGFLSDKVAKYLRQAAFGYNKGIEDPDRAESYEHLPFDCAGLAKLQTAGVTAEVTGKVSKVAPTPAGPKLSKLEEAIFKHHQLKNSLDLIKLSGLEKILSGDKPTTLYLPNNDAWEDLFRKTKTGGAVRLYEKHASTVLTVLKFHVHEGSDPKGKTMVKSVHGKEVPATSSTFGTAKIVETFRVGESTVHVIDTVQTAETIESSTLKQAGPAQSSKSAKSAKPTSIIVADIKSGKMKGTSPKTVRKEIEPQVKTLEAEPKEESEENPDVELDIE